MLNDKSILITGGTGSFGQKFTALALQAYPHIREIVIFSRDPQKQLQMAERFAHHPLRFICGDMGNPQDVNEACKNMDLIIHTAAIRIAGEAEANPWQAVQSNVIGAQNLIEAASTHRVGQILALSTDMASLVNNVYGATKMLSDKLFIDANRRYAPLKTSIIRYGNMLGSQGTVIPFFIKKAQEEGILPITDFRMTRFLATPEECVKIAFQALRRSIGGEIIAPKIKSYNILTIAKAVDEKAALKQIGLRPGEKLYETMVTRYDSFRTIETNDSYIIVPPYADTAKYCQHYSALPVSPEFEFNSENNPNQYTVAEIKQMIKSM